MRRIAVLLGLLCWITPAMARAGSGAIIIPPLRADFGALGVRGVTDGQAGAHNGAQLLIGIHWASLWPESTPVDIGGGLVTSFVFDDRLGPGVGVMRSASVVVEDMAEDDDDSDKATMVGGYLDLAARVAQGSSWRAWLGARGELLRAEVGGRDVGGMGGVARVAAEIYGGTVGGGSNGAAMGVAAIGVYAELGYRTLPGPLGGVSLSSGVSVRVPFIIAGG